MDRIEEMQKWMKHECCFSLEAVEFLLSEIDRLKKENEELRKKEEN